MGRHAETTPRTRPPGTLIWEGRQRCLLRSPGKPSLAQNGRREGKCSSSSAPECLWFLPLGAGRVPAPQRERREVSFPDRAPNPTALLQSQLCYVWMSVFAPRARARPEPRTTRNSAHSRLNFLQTLLPEETAVMAGVERGWGVERGEAV